MSESQNEDDAVFSLTIPKVVFDDMSREDIIGFSLLLAIMLVVIIALCCVNRLAYLNHISMDRIEKELERQER